MNKAVLKKLMAETRSVTAVEFALIGPVLFLSIFLVMLLGVVQFWQLTLDDSVRNAARQVSLGAATTTAGIHNAADFVTSICNEFGQGAPNCTASLQYSVQGGATFTGGITPATLSSAGVLSNTATFSNVTASQPVLVQAAYIIPISVPLVPLYFLTMNGSPAIISAAAIVAEP